MLFEIYNKSGQRVFWTEHESCIPKKDQLKQMAKSNGYTYKLDGKRWKP